MWSPASLCLCACFHLNIDIIFVDVVVICTLLTTQVTEYLIVATPHKRPHITPAMGFELVDEVVKERVRVRLYKSLCQLPPLLPAKSNDKDSGDFAVANGDASAVADGNTSGATDVNASAVADGDASAVVDGDTSGVSDTAVSDATVTVDVDC